MDTPTQMHLFLTHVFNYQVEHVSYALRNRLALTWEDVMADPMLHSRPVRLCVQSENAVSAYLVSRYARQCYTDNALFYDPYLHVHC